MNNILVITSIVLKELIRRKDAYVLLIITVLLTLLSGSVNFFGDLKMVRYVKELCLLLVWISAGRHRRHLTARQIHAERESRTLVFAALQTGEPQPAHPGEIFRLLARLRHGVAGVLRLLCRHRRFARRTLAADRKIFRRSGCIGSCWA